MRVAIYARVSTEKQERQETINSQLDALREYAKSNSHIVYSEYIDEGYSGELLDRPALDKLRDEAKKKLFEAVLIHSPDRLSRKYIYQGLVEEELKKNDIRIVFLNRPDSKDTPEDNLLAGMQGLIAEFEKAKILERTRRGRLHKAKVGVLVTSQAPYGYKYIVGDKTKNIPGHYELEVKEAKVVKLIFDLLVNERLSVRAIIREITRRGIPPRKGKKWGTSSMHRIVRNESYTGVTHYNKHFKVEPITTNNKYRRIKRTSLRLRPKDQWIAITLPDNLKIIDKKTFDLAQAQLKKNAAFSPRNVKRNYLLRGLLECGKCSSPYNGEACHGVEYYRCGNRHRTFPFPRECQASAIKGGTLENAIWDKLCEAFKNPKLITTQIGKLKIHSYQNKDSVVNEAEGVEKQLHNTNDEENRILDAYREKIISLDQLKEQMVKVQEKRKQLINEKQSLLSKQEKNISFTSVKKTINDYCNQVATRLDKLKDDFDGKRQLLLLAVNRIVIEDGKARIKGIIPSAPVPDNNAFCHIASTTSF